jgi:hypothetical protein
MIARLTSALPSAAPSLLAAATLLVAGALVDRAVAEPVAVVELFTSQGCSSCPPADRLMTEWARDPKLVAISMPVDYWDYLGWRDTLAKHDFTLRQQAYAHRRGDRDVYTPQVVVNGAAHVVGSQKGAVDAAVRSGPGRLPVTVGIANSLNGYIVSAGAGPGPGDVILVPIKRTARVAIDRGENGGSSVTYANVARDLRKIGRYEGKPMTLTLGPGETSAPDADSFAILIQAVEHGRPGAILGAAMLPEASH